MPSRGYCRFAPLFFSNTAYRTEGASHPSSLYHIVQILRGWSAKPPSSLRFNAGERCFARLSRLTAPLVVPENKLRLCRDRDELAIRRCDARLPHHRPPPAMQGRRFTDNLTADGCGAYEVGFAFDRGRTG